MGRRRTPGLYKRGGCWYIDKRVNGKRLFESTGADNLEEAERYLARRMEMQRQAAIYGVRPKRLFREAATRFLLENQHKASIDSYAQRLKELDAYIGNLALESVHLGCLQTYIQAGHKRGLKARTINYGLQAVRRVLNLAASEWVDEYGLTWLAAAPKIKLLPQFDARKPYPLSWEEQARLLSELPDHLAKMMLFAANTGCRDAEICNLRWNWEIKLPIGGSVFLIPSERVKNREDRLVVLNKQAQAVVEEMRERHIDYVFTYKGKPIQRMLNSAWLRARKQAGLGHVRVHDLKHTFGRRLRAAGVSFEDRQDLLGHKSGRITTHYSAAELENLLQAANKVCDGTSAPSLVLLRRVV